MTKAARCAENMATTLLSQHRQHCPNDGKCAKDIRVIKSPDLVRAGFFNRADQGIAGVIENDVETPEAIVSLCHGGLHLIGFGYIEFQSQSVCAVLVFEIGNAFQRACGSCDLIAAFQRGFGPNASKPSRRARDEPDFSRHAILLLLLSIGVFWACSRTMHCWNERYARPA